MPFSELVKIFEKIRSYMREFYVYGFRSRSDFGDPLAVKSTGFACITPKTTKPKC